ncbi:Inner membrane symporter yihP [Raoultella terrigena]|uniref:Inner membrane symporter yihP n=1 Tax=Raoultella terrigena TaxID=577 RepID=A0A3P8M146_RAOTE|nr:Inner membrane symporter yihP [Raoultella terrigena]
MSTLSIEREPSADDRIGFRERLAFGLGDYGTNLTYTMMVTFLAWFYTDVVGISAALIGSLMFFARVVDGVICVFVGIRIDKTETRLGKARPWVLWTAVPFGLSAFLMATVPDIGDSGKIIYVCVTYLLANIFFTANNIAYGSLLALITRDTWQRGVLSVFRKGLSTCGSLTVGVFTLPMVAALGNSQTAWIVVFAIFGFFTALCLLLTGAWTRERIKPVNKENRHHIQTREVVRSIIGNRYWLMIFFYLLITFTSLTALSTVSVYYSRYILQDLSLMSWISLAQYTPGLITLLVIPWLIKRLGKRNLALLGLTVCSIAYLLPLFDKTNSLFIILATACAASGSAASARRCSLSSPIPSITASGKPVCGLKASSSAPEPLADAGNGLGSASVGWMLGRRGLSAAVTPYSPPQVVSMIEFLFIAFPFGLALINMAIMYFYRLDTLYEQVEADLSQGKLAE